jgi:hypothetical protein
MPKKPQTGADLKRVVAALRSTVAPFEPSLVPEKASALGFLFNTRALGPNGKPLFFAGAQIRKGYVSFHFFPVYVFPDLLDRMSPELKKRMQGKSCFNFRDVPPPLLRELAKLTESGFKRFGREKLLD